MKRQRPDLEPVVAEYASGLSKEFMADKILPVLKRIRKDGTVYIVPLGNITLSSGDLKRNPKTGYARIETATGKVSYLCEAFGLEEPIDNDDAQDYADKVGGERGTVEGLALYLFRAREKRVATMSLDTAYVPKVDISVKWNTSSGKAYTDILAGVLTLSDAVGGAIGGGKVCLSCSKKAFNVIINNAEIKTKQGRGAGTVKNQLKMTAAELAEILDIDEVNVSNAKIAEEKDGVMTDIWDKTKVLLHIRYDGESTKSNPHFGRTVQWTGRSPALLNVDTYDDDQLDSEVFRVRHNLDEIIHTVKAGLILNGIQ